MRVVENIATRVRALAFELFNDTNTLVARLAGREVRSGYVEPAALRFLHGAQSAGQDIESSLSWSGELDGASPEAQVTVSVPDGAGFGDVGRVRSRLNLLATTILPDTVQSRAQSELAVNSDDNTARFQANINADLGTSSAILYAGDTVTSVDATVGAYSDGTILAAADSRIQADAVQDITLTGASSVVTIAGTVDLSSVAAIVLDAGTDVTVTGQDLTAVVESFVVGVTGPTGVALTATDAAADVTLTAGDQTTLNGSDVNLNASGNVNASPGGTFDVLAGNDVILDAVDDVAISAGDRVDLTSAGLTDIHSTGSYVLVRSGGSGWPLYLRSETGELYLESDNAIRRRTGPSGSYATVGYLRTTTFQNASLGSDYAVTTSWVNTGLAISLGQKPVAGQLQVKITCDFDKTTSTSGLAGGKLYYSTGGTYVAVGTQEAIFGGSFIGRGVVAQTYYLATSPGTNYFLRVYARRTGSSFTMKATHSRIETTWHA